MKDERIKQITARLEATNPGPWSRGRLLDTPPVRRWSAVQRYEVDNRERHMVFANFSAVDQGLSRQFIANVPNRGWDNVSFVENSWEDVRDLLAYVAHLRETLEYTVQRQLRQQIVVCVEWMLLISLNITIQLVHCLR